jgi:hypothetical protein
MIVAMEPKGTYAIGTIAYLGSCLLSSAAFAILEFGTLDFGKASLIAIGMALFALVPFLVVKTVMGVFQCDGLVSDLVGGSVAGGWSCLLLLSHGEAFGLQVLAFFGAWGAIAGVAYWALRQFGQKLLSAMAA